MRELAECLIHYEAKKSPSASRAASAFHVCEKLRPHLSTLMGRAGFRALVSRALVLAATEAPGLHALQVGEDGALAGYEAFGSPAEAQKVTEGTLVLLAQILGLLDAFIGQDLTQRMLRDVWPKISLSDQTSQNDTK